jgi:hypothetical protein
MTTVVTRGAASAQALGYASSSASVNYIEDAFSTYLYTGTGANLTINNGVDLSGKGGLTWIKQRSGSQDHTLFDTLRGVNNYLRTNSTGAQNPGGTYTDLLTAFNSNGFTLGADASSPGFVNASGSTYASWTFREQPKFFDIVTYTGDGTNRTIAHNLGSVPGCVMVKRLDSAGSWWVWHRSLGSEDYIQLQSSAVAVSGFTNIWGPMTSTTFGVDNNASACNINGATYVAYLFAHNAGGFGLTGTDNVISCGTYEGNTSTLPVINLGYEPQWILIKSKDTVAADWMMFDNMRSLPAATQARYLRANVVTGEQATSGSAIKLLPTGFEVTGLGSDINYYDTEGGFGANYIYVAIRRGPMKVPTDATKVFIPNTYLDSTSLVNVTTGFPVDLVITGSASSGISNSIVLDRLTSGDTVSNANILQTSASSGQAPTSFDTTLNLASNTRYQITSATNVWSNPGDTIYSLSLRRAPSYFDEVYYTGTATNRTISHNLGAVPELMLIKTRTGASLDWQVYSATLAATEYLVFNTTAAKVTSATHWNSTRPTASVFSLGTAAGPNTTGATYTAYLFATCPGVSKVGSYTGTGTTLQINCGFAAGARFVMIKRTSSTGDWYFWDSARGIVAGNDPYLAFNSTGAQVTGTDYVDTFASGFEISSTAPAAINASGGTFIFWAIA